MMTDTLLIELLTEELPPKSLNRLSDAFASGMTMPDLKPMPRRADWRW